jgi:hypothetical protein
LALPRFWINFFHKKAAPRTFAVSSDKRCEAIAKILMRINLDSTHIILYVLLSTLAGALGCRKDVDVFRPYPPSVDDIRLTLAQVPDPATRTVFTLNALDRDTVLMTAGGIRIFLTDTEFLFEDALSGAPVPCSSCVTLQAEVIEVMEKGDILARELPSATIQDEPIECAFIVYVKIYCNGRELKPRQDRYVKVQVPASGLLPGLSLWEGVGANGKLTGWSAAANASDVYWANWPIGNTQVTGYELIAKNLGWLSAAKVLSGQFTSFCIQMPPGFDAENSQAFLLLKDNNSVFPLLLDPDNEVFCVDGVPSGYPVQLITLSKLGNQFLLGNSESEIGTNSKVIVSPQQTTAPEIIQIIKNL